MAWRGHLTLTGSASSPLLLETIMYLKALEYHNERKVINQYKNFDDAASNPNYCLAKRELYAKYRDRMEDDGGEVGWIVAKYNKGYIS